MVEISVPSGWKEHVDDGGERNAPGADQQTQRGGEREHDDEDEHPGGGTAANA